MKGLEPPRPETLDPKSNAATITPHAQVGNDLWCKGSNKFNTISFTTLILTLFYCFDC